MGDDSLNIVLQGSSEQATQAIDETVVSLEKLYATLGKNNGVSTFVNNMNQIKQSLASITNLNADTSKLTVALNSIKNSTNFKIPASLANNLQTLITSLNQFSNVNGAVELAKAIKVLSEVSNGRTLSKTWSNNIGLIIDQVQRIDAETIDKLKIFSDNLSKLSSVNKSNLGYYGNHIKKISESLKGLETIDLSSLTQYMTQLNNIMTPLSETMKNVGAGFSSIPKELGKVSTSFTKHNGSIHQTYNLFTRLDNSISTLIGSARQLFGVWAVGQQFVGRANQYVEAVNLFDVAMGSASESAHDFIMKLKELMGIDPTKFMQAQGTFKMIATGYGIAEEQANIMSKQLTQLAYDASSYFNIGIEESMKRFQSAISGQIEPVRRLGYAIDQTALQQVALNMGITESVTNMSQAEKTLVRYYALMTQNVKVQGDLARTVVSPANAMKMFNETIQQVGIAIGQILTPVIMTVLPYLRAFAEVLIEVAQAVAQFLGYELPKIDLSTMSISPADVEPIEDLSEGIGNVGKGYERAKAKAKEFKNFLLGFDELNVIPDTPETPTSSGGGAGGAGGGIGKPKKGKGLFDNFKLPEYDFLKGFDKSVRNQIDRIKDQIRSLFDYIAKFKPFLESFAKVMMTALGVNWLLNFLEKLFPSMSNVTRQLQAIVQIGLGAWLAHSTSKNAWYDLGRGVSTVGDALMNTAVGWGSGAFLVATGLKQIFTSLKGWQAGLIGLVVAGIMSLIGAIQGWNKAKADEVAEFLNQKFFETTEGGTSLVELADAFENMTNNIIVANPKLHESAEAFKTFSEKADMAKETVDKLGEAFTQGLISPEEFSSQLIGTIDTFISSSQSSLESARSMILSSVGTVWEEGLEKAGIALPELSGIIEKTFQDSEKPLRDYKQAVHDLTVQYREDKDRDKWLAGITKAQEEYAKTKVSVDEVAKAQSNMENIFKSIDWSSETAMDDFFKRITNVYNESKDEINKSADEMAESLEYTKGLALAMGDEKSVKKLDIAIQGIRTQQQISLAELEKSTVEFGTNSINSIVNQFGTVIEGSTKDIENWDLGFSFEAKYTHIADELSSFLTNENGVGNKVITGFNKMLSDVGSNAEFKVDEVMGNLRETWQDGLANGTFDENTFKNATLKGDLNTYFKEVGDVFDVNVSDIHSRISNGILNQESLKKQAEALGMSTDLFTDEIKNNQPKVEEAGRQLGESVPDNIVSGVADNEATAKVKEATKEVADSATNTLNESIGDKPATAGADMVNEFSSSISNSESLNQAKDSSSQLANKAYEGIEYNLNGKSNVFNITGQEAVKSYIDAFNDKALMGELDSAVKNFADATYNAMNDNLFKGEDKFAKLGDQSITSFVNAFSNQQNKAKINSSLSTYANEIIKSLDNELFNAGGNKFQKLGDKAITSFAASFSQGRNQTTIRDSVNTLGTLVYTTLNNKLLNDGGKNHIQTVGNAVTNQLVNHFNNEDVRSALKSSTVDYINGALSGMSDAVANSGVVGAFNNMANSIRSVFVALGQDLATSFNGTLSSISRSVNSVRVSSYNGSGRFNFTLADKLAGGIPMRYYANGGFPDSAEIFIAKENGYPEMVGKIGKRTAVANNDQITEAIAQAVYPAVYRAMTDSANNGKGNGDVVVSIDGREIARAVKREENRQYMRGNR